MKVIQDGIDDEKVVDKIINSEEDKQETLVDHKSYDKKK